MDLEDEDEDDDLWSIITIYYPPNMDNPSPVELFVEITEPKPVQVVIPIKDGDKGSDNEEQSHQDNEDFSDLNLEDIPEDIDDESAVEGENVHLHSTGNTRSSIVIYNNPRAFMSDVDLDAMLAREFPEYQNIMLAHLLDKE
ncbi:hypothetical protein GOBAR_DD15220 [Gossypium barbadense]|nr:hypothetical protein GOBAR_DD15220 [Gossypium barbadense]